MVTTGITSANLTRQKHISNKKAHRNALLCLIESLCFSFFSLNTFQGALIAAGFKLL